MQHTTERTLPWKRLFGKEFFAQCSLRWPPASCAPAHSLPSIPVSRVAAPERRLRLCLLLVHKPTKSNSSVSGSGSRPSGSSSTKHKYTCIKDGCTREADKDSAYCWVHRPSKSSTKSNASYSSKSSYSSSCSSSKNPTRRMIPMMMATMPSTMMTTTMRIATTATRTTQQA